MRRLSLCLCLLLVAAACGAEQSSTAVDDAAATTLSATTLPATTTIAPPIGSGDEREEDYGMRDADEDHEATPGDGTPGTGPPPGEAPVRAPVPVESTAPGSGVGEVPVDLMNAILDHAAGTTGRAPDDFTVVRAEPVVWSDGSLGCPQPGVVYTQALVDGYLVVVENDTTRLEYHASARGGFTLCPPVRDKPVAP